MDFQNSLAFARDLDRNDPLKDYRDLFHIPKTKQGSEAVYFCGNSLGLQPKSAKDCIEQELEDWRNLAVEGHIHAKNPWLPYHEKLSGNMAAVVGSLPSEVVVMNTLTVNLHLMMVSFYKPTIERFKILIDWNPFPSDRYAIASQLRFHGYDTVNGMLEPEPEPGTATIREDQVLKIIEEQGDAIALVLIGGVNYYSGQVYNMKAITDAAKKKGCMVGFDLAHAAGNILLNLHDLGCDFAVWCTYKYLNSGPGSLGACFIHERHHHFTGHRFEGWWGSNKATRFAMPPVFDPIFTAEAWQLSNPPILSMAAINASLQIFAKAGMLNLHKKTELLTGFLMYLLREIKSENLSVITPENPLERGAQVSIQVKNKSKSIFEKISEKGIIADWREPDVIRVAPVPLYNCFEELWQFVQHLKEN